MDASKYFYADKGYIYLSYYHCEFYIPLEYFDTASKFAEEIGNNTIRALGLFNIGLYESGNSKVKIHTLNIPTWTEFFVYDREDRDVKLPWYDKLVPCRVLHFYRDNKVMPDTIIQDSFNIESYLKLITLGKLPRSIPVDKSSIIWQKNQMLNGADLELPAVCEELLLSASYRNKNDLSEKFSKVAGSNADISLYDYEMLSIRQACQYSSTYSAMTFEDFDSMAITSLNRSREKKKENESPLEEIIKL